MLGRKLIDAWCARAWGAATGATRSARHARHAAGMSPAADVPLPPPARRYTSFAVPQLKQMGTKPT